MIHDPGRGNVLLDGYVLDRTITRLDIPQVLHPLKRVRQEFPWKWHSGGRGRGRRSVVSSLPVYTLLVIIIII